MDKLAAMSGCLAASVAIALGAFGAHALKDRLIESGRLEVWQTAVDYHMWHALALLLCSFIPAQAGSKRVAALFFMSGIVFFSGSLYWLALDGPGWLGPITPLGGLAFILGWLVLGYAVCRDSTLANCSK
ncbi:MAG: DUF423 domain-containing protein [Opitutales bacterium]